MFRIYQIESEDPLLRRKYVADEGRNLKLQRVAGLTHRPGAAFALTAGEAVIPFEVTGDLSKDPVSGQEYVLRRFETFGYSPTAKLLANIDSYEFPDAATRDDYMLAAAESLLIFGWSYDGPSQEDGFIRVDVGGRILTLSDIPHE